MPRLAPAAASSRSLSAASGIAIAPSAKPEQQKSSPNSPAPLLTRLCRQSLLQRHDLRRPSVRRPQSATQSHRMRTEPAPETLTTIIIKTLFFAGLIISASGYISPPIAITAGIIFGLSVAHPLPADSKDLSRFLLQASVVALGFGMNLHEVIKAGRSGFLYTAIGILFALT